MVLLQTDFCPRRPQEIANPLWGTYLLVLICTDPSGSDPYNGHKNKTSPPQWRAVHTYGMFFSARRPTGWRTKQDLLAWYPSMDSLRPAHVRIVSQYRTLPAYLGASRLVFVRC